MKLFHERLNANLSQAQLAKLTGLSQNKIYRMESGQWEGIKLVDMLKLSEFFDVSVNGLVDVPYGDDPKRVDMEKLERLVFPTEELYQEHKRRQREEAEELERAKNRTEEEWRRLVYIPDDEDEDLDDEEN